MSDSLKKEMTKLIESELAIQREEMVENMRKIKKYAKENPILSSNDGSNYYERKEYNEGYLDCLNHLIEAISKPSHPTP